MPEKITLGCDCGEGEECKELGWGWVELVELHLRPQGRKEEDCAISKGSLLESSFRRA